MGQENSEEKDVSSANQQWYNISLIKHGTVQSTYNVSLEGDCSQASTCGSASIHTLHFECSRVRANALESSEHLHARVNALVSRNDFWRLFNARATGKICRNLEWRCVLKPRVPTYSSLKFVVVIFKVM